jgi:hypothetical protein
MNVTCHMFFEQNATRPPHYDSHITHSTEQWTTVHSHKLQWRLSGFELQTPAYITRFFSLYFLILFKIQYSTSLVEFLTVAHLIKKFQTFMNTAMILEVLSRRRDFLKTWFFRNDSFYRACNLRSTETRGNFSFDIFG